MSSTSPISSAMALEQPALNPALDAGANQSLVTAAASAALAIDHGEAVGADGPLIQLLPAGLGAVEVMDAEADLALRLTGRLEEIFTASSIEDVQRIIAENEALYAAKGIDPTTLIATSIKPVLAAFQSLGMEESLALASMKTSVLHSLLITILCKPTVEELEMISYVVFNFPEEKTTPVLKACVDAILKDVAQLKSEGASPESILALISFKQIKEILGITIPTPYAINPIELKAMAPHIGLPQHLVADFCMSQTQNIEQLEAVMNIFKENFDAEQANLIGKGFGLDILYYSKPRRSVMFSDAQTVATYRSAQARLTKSYHKENILVGAADGNIHFRDLSEEVQKDVSKFMLWYRNFDEMRAEAHGEKERYEAIVAEGDAHADFATAKAFLDPGLPALEPAVLEYVAPPKPPHAKEEGWKILTDSRALMTTGTERRPQHEITTGIINPDSWFSPENIIALTNQLRSALKAS